MGEKISTGIKILATFVSSCTVAYIAGFMFFDKCVKYLFDMDD